MRKNKTISLCVLLVAILLLLIIIPTVKYFENKSVDVEIYRVISESKFLGWCQALDVNDAVATIYSSELNDSAIIPDANMGEIVNELNHVGVEDLSLHEYSGISLTYMVVRITDENGSYLFYVYSNDLGNIHVICDLLEEELTMAVDKYDDLVLENESLGGYIQRLSETVLN